MNLDDIKVKLNEQAIEEIKAKTKTKKKLNFKATDEWYQKAAAEEASLPEGTSLAAGYEPLSPVCLQRVDPNEPFMLPYFPPHLPTILVSKLTPTAKLPEQKTSGAAGYDICADNKMPIFLQPGDVKMIPTGLRFVIPKKWCAEVYSRSGLAANKAIFVLNSPGLVDNDFRNEVKIILANFGKERFEVKLGDRIAQLRYKELDLHKQQEIPAEEFNKLCEQEVNDRKGGFGSTGV